jgi:hypothetical protein
VGAINLDTCDAVEHRIFSVDLDEEEEDGCGRCEVLSNPEMSLKRRHVSRG